MIIKIELELTDDIDKQQAEELVGDMLDSAQMGDLLNDCGLKEYWKNILVVDK